MHHKKQHIWFFLPTVLASLLFCSCQTDDSLEGPAFADMNAAFGITDSLSLSRSSVDFAKGETVYFTAEFIGIENWVITITDDSAKTRGTITGKSKTINASNATWDGSADALPSFVPGHLTATLTVAGETVTMSKGFNMTSKKKLSGSMIMEFPDNFLDPIWPGYKQNGTQYSRVITTGINGITSPLNDYFLYIGGVVNWDWGIGAVTLVSEYLPHSGTKYFQGILPVANAVYFNAYVYSDTVGVNKEARLMFMIREDDNNDGKWQTSEDEYDLVLSLNWVGWKLISIPYDTLNIETDPNAGQYNGRAVSGNKLQEPHKITEINCNLIANPGKGKALAGIDYIVFTNLTPLKP